MNILYIYSSNIIPEHGGVQRATQVLCDQFRRMGDICYYLSSQSSDEGIQGQYVLPQEDLLHADNVTFVSSFLRDKHIELVVNQDGLNPRMSHLVFESCYGHVRIISVAHNSLLAGVSNFASIRYSSYKKKHIAWILPLYEVCFIKKLLYMAYRRKYQRHFYDVLKYSDKLVLLSDGLKKELAFFCSGYSIDKVVAIPNPCTLVRTENMMRKLKTVLFVGRISFGQKRPDLLLKVWSKVMKVNSEWKLKIVGNGEDLENLRKLAKKMNLTNVLFEGYQSPEKYYQEASIFCMTSSFEGFPLVLGEAMSHRGVPIAFDSFAAAQDIIDNGKNGFLITPFKIDEYANCLSTLMSDEKMLERLATEAEKKSKKFELTNICKQWHILFDN